MEGRSYCWAVAMIGPPVDFFVGEGGEVDEPVFQIDNLDWHAVDDVAFEIILI